MFLGVSDSPRTPTISSDQSVGAFVYLPLGFALFYFKGEKYKFMALMGFGGI